MKIPCCHNTLIMPGCFAVWWVEGQVVGVGGGGIRLDTCGYFKTKNSRHFSSFLLISGSW